MKRKGVLKKMIGALCIGALICMPVTANATERADIVGSWDGGLLSVTFDENGMATDQWNTKPYLMESGSITVTYCSSGTSETLGYDFWRGYQLKDVPDDTRMDAVIYKIIEPGKLKAWNVFKEAGTDEWQSYDPVILTKGQIKEEQKKEDKGSTVTFDNRAWLCYPQYVLDALREKGDVSLKTDFTYQGINYSFIIPAGSDYSNLEKADFYGFMYLCNAFGGTVVE